MAARGYLVGGFEQLFLGNLDLVEALVDRFNIIVLMLLEQL